MSALNGNLDGDLNALLHPLGMDFTSSRSDRAEGAAFGSPPQSHLAWVAGALGLLSGPELTKMPRLLSCNRPLGSLLRLREGTQLLGRYEGSAYEQPTYLVRRDDGQVIHLSHLLYLVAALIDGERDLTDIAEALSTQLGRQVVADNVEHLVEKKLRPSGLIASAVDGDQAKALPGRSHCWPFATGSGSSRPGCTGGSPPPSSPPSGRRWSSWCWPASSPSTSGCSASSARPSPGPPASSRSTPICSCS